jgi:hypothetical protein
MAKDLIEYSVFDAGMNTKADPVNLLPGQSDNLNNVVFGDYGSIRARDGISTHNSTPMSNAPIAAIASYRPPGMSALLMAACDGGLYVMTGSATAPVSVPSAADRLGGAGHVVWMAQMNGILFTGSPSQAQQYKSQSLTAVCDAASGNLNGTYQYIYWGVNSYAAEGDYVVNASTAVAVASAHVRINNIPTAPVSHGINTWKVGRNTAGVQGLYWYLTDVTNGTSSFTDNVADSSLVTLAPTDQGYPRRFYCTCVYAGRFWGAVDDYLWYSEIDEPEIFPSTNFIRVGKGSGLSISSIVPFMGMIVVSMSDFRYSAYAPNQAYGQRTSLHVLRIGDSIGFSDPENWYLNLIAENEGSESQNACLPMAGYLWMTGRKGVSLFDGASVANAMQETSTGGVITSKISDAIESLFELDTPSSVRLSCAIEWKNKIYLCLDRNSGAGSWIGNDTTLVYDYMRVGQADPKKGAWSKFDGAAAAQFVVHEDNLYGAGPFSPNAPITGAGGYIYRWDSGSQVDGYGGFTTTYRMNVIRGHKDHVYNDKDFRIVNVWASGTGEMVLTFKVNGNNYDGATAVYTQTITLTAAGTKTQIKLPGAVSGKHLWIQLSLANWFTPYTVDLNLTRIQVFYNLRGLRNA